MGKYGYLALIFGLSIALGACSSSGMHEDGDLDGASGSDEIPELDAATDAVPVGDAEQPAPIDGAQPTDVAAAPEPLPEGSPTPISEMPPPAAVEPTPPPPMADATPPTTPPPAVETAAAPTPPPPASSGGKKEYTVQNGDTLMKIAFETYADVYKWRQIYNDNKDKINDPNNVPPGTVLMVEEPASPVSIDRNGEKFLIRRGDTLGKISDEVYGTPSKWRKIYENNRQLIKDPNKIFAGFYLYYTMTPEERDEADKLRQNRGTTPPPLAHSESAPAVEPGVAAAIVPPVDATNTAAAPGVDSSRVPAGDAGAAAGAAVLAPGTPAAPAGG